MIISLDTIWLLKTFDPLPSCCYDWHPFGEMTLLDWFACFDPWWLFFVSFNMPAMLKRLFWIFWWERSFCRWSLGVSKIAPSLFLCSILWTNSVPLLGRMNLSLPWLKLEQESLTLISPPPTIMMPSIPSFCTNNLRIEISWVKHKMTQDWLLTNKLVMNLFNTFNSKTNQNHLL